MKKGLILREIRESDCELISQAFQKQGWPKPVSQYQQYLKYQAEGSRDILIAEIQGEFAGYLTILWTSHYQPFREKQIPEIVDFNVLKKFQRQGIGTALMDEAERRIQSVSKYAGIGFGLYKDYGAAQILYVKRGYVPDGNGIVIDSQPVAPGSQVRVDDDLVFCLIKEF
ncbi:MAG: GNAT family N-acetyltransferase [Bacteroidota bacterium]